MLQSEAIKNILTLRYDPNSQSPLKKLFWEDFLRKSSTNEVNNVESIIKKSIREFVDKNNIKKTTLALSGGIDSMLILSLFRKTCPDVELTCISAGFSEDDEEVKNAKQLAYKFDCNFDHLTLENFLINLPLQINIIKEPKWHYYWFFIAEAAKKYSNSLLSGDGGDELMGGYVFRYKKFLSTTNSNNSWESKVKSYLNCHNRDWVNDQSSLFGKKMEFSWEKIYHQFQTFFDNPLNELDQIFLADYNGKLMHDWIPCLDKIHSFFGLKGFAPMINEELINYSCCIPSEKKYDYQNNQGKLILRKILKNHKLIINEGKRGFSPNLFNYWKIFGKEIISLYLIDSQIAKDEIINQKWILDAINHVEKEKDIRYINKLLSVLSLEIWYRLFVSKEIKPSDKLL